METFPTLSSLLISLRNSKRKKEFIKYIGNMKYTDFKTIWVSYSQLLIRKTQKYNKCKFPSVGYYKKKTLHIYYSEMFILFRKANKKYIEDIGDEMSAFSEKVIKILNVVAEREAILKHIQTIDFTKKELFDDKIKLVLVIMESIYSQEELQKAIEELKEMRRFK